MRFGLAHEDYAFIQRELEQRLKGKATVWCFGSRARGNHKPFSDLDLMIECEVDVTRELAELKEVFEESRLPIKVDLVELKDFAQSYRAGFEKDKVIF